MNEVDRNTSNRIEYLVACISEFAKRFRIKTQAAYVYLSRFKGLDYLNRHYEAIHTLSIDDAVDDLVLICARNGGGLTV